ncbi:MAG: hypothetical protein A2Y15_02260 [Clostridiales bacterium GWF2_36_10]|nr:MAG: hypothetical protein A2Y15_02260 [Clostridiales bacterium GWF2_36_10]HAN21281.1 hypothetical protein [Clostridiales bacterium]
MKILWVSTSPIGPASRILSLPYQGTSGGWIQTEYEALSLQDVSMFFLCASPEIPLGQVKHASSSEGEAYCVNLPKISYGIKPSEVLKNNIENIIKEISPDIIQIWGTESCISYLASECCSQIKKVIFLQGLVGVHTRYMGGYIGLSKDRKYYKGVLLTEKLKNYIREHCFKNQVYYEQKALLNCSNVITDNDFTKAYCQFVSKDINSYNHSLFANNSFKNELWDYDQCEKNSIFTVYGITADKGLHQLLKSLIIVKKSNNDITLYIPGAYSSDNHGHLKLSKHMRPFERWMYNYIKENDLWQNVIFVGKLSTPQMIEYLKKCNLFVNPSCMEVHALSLREALTMGVPCISSLCGSIIEYVEHKINGLIYRFEEHEVLAYDILKVLQYPDFACKLGKNAELKMRNFKASDDSLSLMDIYKKILYN